MAADADDLAREPLFRALHERHPDVDIVVLPPVSTAPPSVSATPEEAAEVARTGDRLLDALLAVADRPEPSRTADWTRGNSAHWHRLVLRSSLRDLTAPGEVEEVLSELTNLVGSGNWTPVADSRADLAARADGFLLEVDAFPEAIDLCLSSGHVPVSIDVLEQLEGEA